MLFRGTSATLTNDLTTYRKIEAMSREYAKNPKRNMTDLLMLIGELERYGFVHDKFSQPVDSMMSILYPASSDKHTLASNDFPVNADIKDYEDQIEIFSVPPTNELWEYIDNNEKEQFVQDLRNAIQLCLFENGHKLIQDVDIFHRLIDMRSTNKHDMPKYLVTETD